MSVAKQMEKQQQGSSKIDRKTVEKNRRNQMKTLYSELNSLIPPSHKSKGVMPLSNQLDEAVNYIKKLENKLERMKEKKNYLMGINSSRSMSGTTGGRPPQIEIHCSGSLLEVVLVSGMDCQSLFFKIIGMLHEEEAITVNANFSIANDYIFHTIHAEVAAPSVEYETERISSRLKNFVTSTNALHTIDLSMYM